MNGVVKINKCSVNKVMRVVHDTKNAYSVCLFTANYTKQAEAFPDNIQKYGTTALFKVSSYHLPAKLLGKISFNLEGHWEKDTHGTKGDEKIFVAEKASESMPETRAEIIKFLMNSSKGVGKVTAETIYNKFGDETLDICAHKPRRLRDIPKMTEQMLGNINAACLSALVRADVQILLGKAELEVSVINQIVEAYGDEATTILKSEPYKLVRLLGFSTTDHIAMSMGEEPDSERRLRAATIEAQKRTCSKTGNMCAEGSAMLLQLKALVPELSDETIADAVAKTASDYDIVRQGRYYYDMQPIIDRYSEAEMQGVKTSLQAPELIAPEWIDFTHYNYIVIDGKFYTFAYIPSTGYNQRVYAGWIATFVNAGEGIDVDMFFEHMYSAFLLLHLRKNLQSYNKKTIKKDFPQFKKLHDETKKRLQNSHEWLPASVGF